MGERLRVDVEELGGGVWRIDTFERGHAHRAAAYAVDGGTEVALVEVGAAPGVASLRAGLRAAGLQEARVRYVFVTHVHLDHAGACGQLAQAWPQAVVVAHPRGVAHLADPGRLEASARQVYGERFDTYFGQLLPVPSHQLAASEDGGRWQVGERTLVTWHTPGHAPHHQVVEDPETHGIFTGDAAGIRYASLSPWGAGDFHLPTTSPPRFDPEAMVASLDRMRERRPWRLYFTHFGMGEPAEAFLQACREEVMRWAHMAREAPDAPSLVRRLRDRWRELLAARGITDLDRAWEAADLDLDLDLDGQGLWVYAQRLRSQVS